MSHEMKKRTAPIKRNTAYLLKKRRQCFTMMIPFCLMIPITPLGRRGFLSLA